MKNALLSAALVVVGFLLLTTWQKEHPSPAHPQSAAIKAPTAIDSVPVATPENHIPKDRLITIHTDLLTVDIDKKDGNIARMHLNTYPASLKEKDTPFQLMDTHPEHLNVAEMGIMSTQRPQSIQYQVAQQTPWSLVLTAQQGSLSLKKTYTFHPNRYTIDVTQHLHNQGNQPWQGTVYTQLRHHKNSSQQGHGLMDFHTFRGAAFYDGHHYQKLSYSHMDKKVLNRTIDQGWIAMQQRYFLTAWVPSTQANNRYYTQSIDQQWYTIGILSQPIQLQPQQQQAITATLYAGPEITERLKTVAPGLDLTIDYGWLWAISLSIFWVMQHINALVGNWGIAIILVTLFIKLLFFKLSESSYRSMAKMKQLQPKLLAIKSRCGNDKQRLSQETMQLYREQKVNPMGGCLPFLIQIPFFIALYYVLIESVALRHAPFVFWIQDLSAKDPFFVLPILMGASMFLQQKMAPASPDPTQAKVMHALPVLFTVFFLNVPSGLVLYWLTNNLLSILQQWYISRRF